MRRPSTTTADAATARLQTVRRLLDAGASGGFTLNACLLPLFRSASAIRAVHWLISDSLPLWLARVHGVGHWMTSSARASSEGDGDAKQWLLPTSLSAPSDRRT